MPHYFQKCCFETDVIAKRTECDRLSCEGKHTEFTVFHHKINNEVFYCLNRKQLEEYWKCVIKDKEVFCPEKCNNCVVCKFLTGAYDVLKDAFFFQLQKTCLISLFCGEFSPMLLTNLIKLFLELK